MHLRYQYILPICTCHQDCKGVVPRWGLTYHLLFSGSCKFAVCASLELLKAGPAWKLNIALHVFFSAG